MADTLPIVPGFSDIPQSAAPATADTVAAPTESQPRDVSNDPVYIVHAQHYGFEGDKGEDLHSKNGVGDWNNPLTSGSSIALSPDMVDRFGAKPGEQFIFTGRDGVQRPFTFGATTNDNLRGTIDVYDKDGQTGELGQGTISRPGANGPRIPALQTSNTEIQKLPLSFGLRVATPDDVANVDQYIQTGGDPNALPLNDRLAVAIAKNPNFFKENPEAYYQLIAKPLMAQPWQKNFNDMMNGLWPGLLRAGGDVVQGVGNQLNLLKDGAEMAVRKATDNTHDPGFQTLQSRTASEMATSVQGTGDALSQASSMLTGLYNGLIQTPRPLFEMAAQDPQSREELDRQFAQSTLDTASLQQGLATAGSHLRQWVGQAYQAVGQSEFGKELQTAPVNQSAAAGIATVLNPINYAGELAGAAATGALKPMFFEKGMQAMEDVAGASALKGGLDATQMLPKTPEASAANAGYVETRNVMSQLAPAQRAATEDLAQKTANLNAQITNLNKIAGDPGTAASMANTVLQATGNVAQAAGKLPELGEAVKDKLTNIVSLGIPGVKKIASSVIDKVVDYGVFEHFGPVGTAISTTLEHLPEIGDAVSSLSKVMGKELMVGEATIPYWTRVAQGSQYMPKWLAATLDHPLMQTATAAAGGTAAGAATGAVLGGLQGEGTSPGGGWQGAAGGLVQGGIFGMAGGGFGQWQKFSDPAQYFLQARGDWKRYRDTLNTNKVIPMPEPIGEPPRPAGAPPLLGSERDNFDRLSASNQLLLAQNASHFPGLRVDYVNDPQGANGFHYFDNAGRSHIQINLANPDSVVRGVMAHELIHGATHNGILPDLYDSLLGNPTTGATGQYTALGPDEKPLGINQATDRYYTNQTFNNLAAEYKNKMQQNGLPTSHLTDFDIAKELYAEGGVDYMLSGAPILDSNSAFRPLMANKAAIKTALAKMGYTVDESGKLLSAPGGRVSGTGLFTDLQRNPIYNQLAQSYFKTTQREGQIDSEEAVTHRFTRGDMQNPNVANTWLTNAAEIVRNPDGTVQRNPLTGEPIYRTAKEVKEYNANFANAVQSGLEALPESQRMELGMRTTTDEQGKQNTFVRYLPDNILDSLAGTNQYNPHQIASLRLLSRVLADKGQPGMEMRLFYHKALGAGKKYGQFEGTEKTAVPYGLEISKDNNVNIKSIDFNQLTQNYQRMAKRDPFRGLWASPSEFTQDAHTYFTNHANGRPGADAIGVDKRNAINALSNLDVVGQRDANPLVDRMPASVRPIVKSYRIDRANQISATGAIRPFISEDQYYQMKRNYMPGAEQVSYAPRGTPTAPEAPPDKTAIPVSYRTTSSGKQVPVEIPYDIANAPLVANKQPTGLSKDSPNDFSHVDFMGKLDQQRLTHLDNASATGAFAKKLVAEYARWKDNPDVMAAKTWYTDVRGHLETAFGKDAELFAHLLAATSPQQGVVENWHDALEAYRRYKLGAYDGAIQKFQDTGKITEDMKPKKENGAKFGMNSDAVLKVLAGTWLDSVKGPKTPNFFDNLFGRGTDATIDDWAARTMRRLGYENVKGAPAQWRIQPASKSGVSNLDFAFSQEAFRRAADKLGMDSHELQAILWYAEKHEWAERGWAKGGAQAAKASYVPMLKSLAENVKSGRPLMEAIAAAGKQ